MHFRHGWHKDIPEIYELDADGERVPTRLYDPFKGDVYVLGMVFNEYFGKVRLFFYLPTDDKVSFTLLSMITVYTLSSTTFLADARPLTIKSAFSSRSLGFIP